MHINYQQNQVTRSDKTVYTNIFAKNCNWHKFATTNSNFEKSIFLDMLHHKMYMYINFQQNLVKTQVVHMHHPLTDIQADFEMNRPTRYLITAERNY